MIELQHPHEGSTMLRKKTTAAFLATAMWLAADFTAGAFMGGETIMSRVDTDGDKTLSLAEVQAAAGGRYDLIRDKNGRVTMLQLGGRVAPSDLKGIGKDASGVASPVSRDDYLALAAKFFDEANAKRKDGDAPGAGTLNIDELGSPAGKNLVGLLQ